MIAVHLDHQLLVLACAEPGEWSPGGLVLGAEVDIVVLGNAAEQLGHTREEVQAARERLVRAGLLYPGAVRLMAWPRSLVKDLHRAIMARVGISPPAGLSAREIAAALGRAKSSGDPDGALQNALDYLYQAGHLSPPSALWPTAAGRARVEADGVRVAA